MGSIKDLLDGSLDTSSDLADTVLNSVGGQGLELFSSLDDLIDTDN